MTLDFAIRCSLVRPGRPRYPVLVHRAASLLYASFRPHLAATPLRFANPSPPSGWVKDLHLQAVDHARHTTKTALLPAPFWYPRVDRPTSTGAGGSDPLWLCWRGKPWLAIRWRGYAASKWSQLERQPILDQRLSAIAASALRCGRFRGRRSWRPLSSP
jgi:hypothetical protein